MGWEWGPWLLCRGCSGNQLWLPWVELKQENLAKSRALRTCGCFLMMQSMLCWELSFIHSTAGYVSQNIGGRFTERSNIICFILTLHNKHINSDQWPLPFLTLSNLKLWERSLHSPSSKCTRLMHLLSFASLFCSLWSKKWRKKTFEFFISVIVRCQKVYVYQRKYSGENYKNPPKILFEGKFFYHLHIAIHRIVSVWLEDGKKGQSVCNKNPSRHKSGTALCTFSK